MDWEDPSSTASKHEIPEDNFVNPMIDNALPNRITFLKDKVEPTVFMVDIDTFFGTADPAWIVLKISMHCESDQQSMFPDLNLLASREIPAFYTFKEHARVMAYCRQRNCLY